MKGEGVLEVRQGKKTTGLAKALWVVWGRGSCRRKVLEDTTWGHVLNPQKAHEQLHLRVLRGTGQGGL